MCYGKTTSTSSRIKVHDVKSSWMMSSCRSRILLAFTLSLGTLPLLFPYTKPFCNRLSSFRPQPHHPRQGSQRTQSQSHLLLHLGHFSNHPSQHSFPLTRSLQLPFQSIYLLHPNRTKLIQL